MPREPKADARIIQGPNGLVAAAVRLSGKGSKGGKVKTPPWYTLAWHFYDVIGEYRYACNWVGNLLSRAILQVWKDGEIVTEGDAVDAMKAFFGGQEGQREFLRQSGTQLTVPGDYYVVGEEQAGDDPDTWRVLSATRLKNTGTKDQPIWKLGNDILEDPLVIRLWRPHPNDETKSDSPSRAVLPILSELENLTKYVASQVSSRLASSGIFVVPNEMTFGSARANVAVNGDATDNQNVNTGINAFLIELYETISANLADPEDASARVPILLSGPGDSIQHMRHITFATELDKQTKVLRDEAIRRLALGMDMPPEILTGSGDLNHWNAWQVEEASIKAHTEPLLQIITSGVTEQYLWPYLRDVTDMSEEEVRSYVLHADTSKIRLRPNRSKEALELYDRGILSLEATARENGFDPADLMGDEERKTWQTRKVAGGSTTPELVAWALKALGLAVPDSALTAPEAVPTEAPSDRSLTDHPERRIPDPTQAEVDASEVAVFRALERAGAKLRSKYKTALVPGADTIANAHLYRYAHLSEEMYDDLLAGAWEICSDLAISMSPAMMDAYVRHLFTSKEQFTSPNYRRFMSHTLVRVA